jgi:hypothetical protein
MSIDLRFDPPSGLVVSRTRGILAPKPVVRALPVAICRTWRECAEALAQPKSVWQAPMAALVEPVAV